MKIFYSELAENPAFYSFGYSIYGIPEPEDSMDELYEQGFLPCVVAREQPGQLMYQARGVRVRVQEFTRRHYHTRVARKAAELGALEVIVHSLADFAFDTSVEDFFLRYFTFRFGKDAMPRERLQALVASGWVTHVSECRINGVPVAYMLEHHANGLIHVWYQVYEKQYEHAHLGSHLYTLLIERAKGEGKRHVYFGVSYGSWMKYKANFAPLEYWDGSSWVLDGNGKKLKSILEEGVTLVPYADRWRAARAPFYYSDGMPLMSREAKFISMLFDGAPRITLLVIGIPVLLFSIAFFISMFR